MPDQRLTPIELDRKEFRKIGYQLIDSIADLFESFDNRPVTPGDSPLKLQELLGDLPLPENGTPSEDLFRQCTEMIIDHSLFNGHPKFLGYITSSPAPLGVLADLLASAVNPNVGAHILSPVATEIEKQTIRWLAELIGVSPDYGGILVSGGNMANLTAFLAGRTAKAGKNIKKSGLSQSKKPLIIYCSKATHTWIDKAADLFGIGTDAIHWIPTDSANRIDLNILEETIEKDFANGDQPIMVIGTAGDVSTGVVDDLEGIGSICEKYNLWFHVDGAYGIPAAIVPELKGLFNGIEKADSIAMDPHKWLYSPLEAGCTLVKDPQHLLDTYSSHPEYYKFDTGLEGEARNFYEYGFQNSRGFRALKVWMVLQQIGRKGYESMIREDVDLARLLFDIADQHPELEAISHNLSITTFRYVPPDYSSGPENHEESLNKLNQELLTKLQIGGEAFVSNAVVNKKYCLRACIVNFRTSEKDIHELAVIVLRLGRNLSKN